MLDVYNSIRDAADLPPIIDGRHSLMLQERWEGSVLASILAFFFAIWTVRSMHRRGVQCLLIPRIEGFSAGQPPMSMVGALLSHSIPQTTTRPGLSATADPRSHNLQISGIGACRGQGTIAETLAGWSAAVWSADARGLGAGIAFATARGFLGNDYSNNQAEYFALLQCLFRALRLHDPHVIFEVDSLILVKQLARHLPWACRSENLIALHQQCVHVCDFLSARHISWDIRHIYREFN